MNGSPLRDGQSPIRSHVSDLPRTADAVIIGGGIVGTATAWHLARRGAQVALVERDFLAAGASGANLGLLLASSLAPGPLLELALSSIAQYDRVAELDREIAFARRGSIEVMWTADELERRMMLAESQRTAGLPIEFLDATAARYHVPTLPVNIAGAAFSASDASVNPLQAVAAFASAAKKHGACIAARTTVTAIHTRARRVTAVETDRGVIATATVINAAGAWASAVAALAGIAVPIVPVHGQAFVTLAAPSTRGPMVRSLEPFISDLESGNEIIGATADHLGWTGRVTPAALRALARSARARLPQIASTPVLRSWSGLRPCSPDGLPLAGETTLRGFSIAGGTCKQGMLLGPALAEIVACLATGHPPPINPDPFDPNRFAATTSSGEPLLRGSEA